MTTVISRVYADEATADGVVAALQEAGFPTKTINKIKGGGKKLADKITATRVPEDSAAVYAKMLKGDATIVVVRVQISPFGAARHAMSIVDAAGPLATKVATENFYIREEPDMELLMDRKIMRSHPLFLTIKGDTSGRSLMSEVLHWRLLSGHRERHSAMSGTRYMSRRFWPQKLLLTKERSPSVISGGRRMFYNPAKLRRS